MTVGELYETMAPGMVLGLTGEDDATFFDGECELYSEATGEPGYAVAMMSVRSIFPYEHDELGPILVAFV